MIMNIQQNAGPPGKIFIFKVLLVWEYYSCFRYSVDSLKRVNLYTHDRLRSDKVFNSCRNLYLKAFLSCTLKTGENKEVEVESLQTVPVQLKGADGEWQVL